MGIITKGVGGLYTVAEAESTINCNARGLFRKLNLTPLVGDRVVVAENTITEILPRKNELRRPRVANVDQVIIVCAAKEPPLSIPLINRYLAQTEHAEIPAVICINKLDLADGAAESAVEAAKLYESVGYPVILVSAQTGQGMDKLTKICQGKTTVLAGQSGVGKSSLINLLTDENAPEMEVGAVSKKIGRGKHTTRHAEILTVAPSTAIAIGATGATGSDSAPGAPGTSGAVGSYIVDTPGFSSLELPDIPVHERAALMREFRPYHGGATGATGCKFTNCLHNKETDCAIKSQINKTIDPRRYNWYLEWINNLG